MNLFEPLWRALVALFGPRPDARSGRPSTSTLPRQMAGAALAGAVAAGITLPAQAADPGVALVLAARNNQVSSVRKALASGVDPNSTSSEYGPAIVAAAFTKSWDAVAVLADAAGIDLERASPRGETALMLAALNGRLDLVRKLVTKGAEVNRVGWTPLHYAVSGGDLDTVKYLLEESAYIDAHSPNATTPLMMAARQKAPSIATLLIEEGADPTQRNEAGLSAADYFERGGDIERANWLREQARRFEAKYGTIAAPKLVTPADKP